MDPEQTKRAMVRRYVAEHGMDAALDHFTGADGSEQDYSYDTIIKYARGADKKYR